MMGDKYLKKSKDGKIIICDKNKMVGEYESKIDSLNNKIKKFKEKMNEIHDNNENLDMNKLEEFMNIEDESDEEVYSSSDEEDIIEEKKEDNNLKEENEEENEENEEHMREHWGKCRGAVELPSYNLRCGDLKSKTECEAGIHTGHGPLRWGWLEKLNPHACVWESRYRDKYRNRKPRIPGMS